METVRKKAMNKDGTCLDAKWRTRTGLTGLTFGVYTDMVLEKCDPPGESKQRD